MAWKLGKRDYRTLEEFLKEIRVKDRDFATDDYGGYHALIPEKQLFTGKDLTFPIEQDKVTPDIILEDSEGDPK